MGLIVYPSLAKAVGLDILLPKWLLESTGVRGMTGNAMHLATTTIVTTVALACVTDVQDADQEATDEYGGFAVLNIIEKTGKERLYYPILLCDGPCSDKLISNFLFVKAEWM